MGWRRGLRMTSPWISREQQKRDHSGLRDCCVACGHDGTESDPLVVTADTGSRIHKSHYSDPKSGFYGKEHQ